MTVWNQSSIYNIKIKCLNAEGRREGYPALTAEGRWGNQQVKEFFPVNI